MRSRAALSGVSRSWYLFGSIVCLVRCPVPTGTIMVPHLIYAAEKAEIPCCLVHHTDRVCLGASGTPSSAILRGGRRRTERDARGGAASRVAAPVKPANPKSGGRAWHRAFQPRCKNRTAYRSRSRFPQ